MDGAILILMTPKNLGGGTYVVCALMSARVDDLPGELNRFPRPEFPIWKFLTK